METSCMLRRSALLGAVFFATIAMTGASHADQAAHAASLDSQNSMTSDELEQFRGREGMKLVNVQSIQDLKSTVSDSSVNAGSIVSGAITIESGALENFGGVGLFNLMSGHNNAVDTAVGISIYVTE